MAGKSAVELSAEKVTLSTRVIEANALSFSQFRSPFRTLKTVIHFPSHETARLIDSVKEPTEKDHNRLSQRILRLFFPGRNER